MIAISEGEVYNDTNSWSHNIVKDISTGLLYEILWNGEDVYVEITSNTVELFDIIDDVTNIYYQIFVSNGQAFIVPVRDSYGNITYGSNCLTTAGSTLILNINRNSPDIANINDIVVNIFDTNTNSYLFIDTSIEIIKENFFKVTFTLPIRGNFLIIIKVLDELYLKTEIKVEQHSLIELSNSLEKLNINNDKYSGFI